MAHGAPGEPGADGTFTAGGFVLGLVAERDALRTQNAALLEALGKIADPEWGPAEWQPLVIAMQNLARAAIQGAEPQEEVTR